MGLGGGGIEALLRHSIAAVLNAIHPYVGYPLSAAEVIAATNAAIASANADSIEGLKNRLEGYNQLESDLDANGRVPPGLAVTATNTSAAEGAAGSLTYVFTRSADLTDPLPVRLQWLGTATYGVDYTLVVVGGTLSSDGRLLTLPSGPSVATVRVLPVDDAEVESTESVVLTVGPGTYVLSVAGTTSGVIEDNDSPPLPMAGLTLVEDATIGTMTSSVIPATPYSAPVSTVVAPSPLLDLEAVTELNNNDSELTTLTFVPGVTLLHPFVDLDGELMPDLFV